MCKNGEESTIVIIEIATLHVGTFTRNMVITYELDSLRQSHRRMHVQERVEYTTVIIETATLRAGMCTRCRLRTYYLDLSRSIHGSMHVEERVEYHSETGYTPCRCMCKE